MGGLASLAAVADESRMVEELSQRRAAAQAHASDLERKILSMGGLPKVRMR